MKSRPVSREEIDRLRSLAENGKATVDQILECVKLLRQAGFDSNDYKTWRAEAAQILKKGLKRFPESGELTQELAEVIKPPFSETTADPKLLRKAISLYNKQGKFPLADAASSLLASDVFTNGCEALERGDLQIAREHFEQTIEVYPFHADAYVHLGIVYEQIGNWLEAARCYWSGVQLGRIACHQREAWNRRLAKIWHNKSEDKTAYWDELDTRPLLRALDNLALLYYKRKEFDLALQLANESLHLNPNDNTGTRFILYSICRLQERDEWLRKLNKEYGKQELVEEAADLERSCFGSELILNSRKAAN